MITRHGRSASTVSSVRPNSDVPVRRGGSAITNRARVDLARLLHDPAARLARADLLPVAGDAPSAAHARRVDGRLGVGLLLGHDRVDRQFGGTAIVTSTWMPRRRWAASLAAVATPRSSSVLLEGDEHRLGTRPRARRRAWARRSSRSGSASGPGSAVEHVAHAAERQPERAGDQDARSSAVTTTSAIRSPVRRRPRRAARRRRGCARARPAPGSLDVRLGEPQARDRDVRHRERQHPPKA